jgi:hypothetical protein
MKAAIRLACQLAARPAVADSRRRRAAPPADSSLIRPVVEEAEEA